MQEQYMIDKLAGIGVNITWPPVDGALPAPRDAASSPDALDMASQPARQVQHLISYDGSPLLCPELADWVPCFLVRTPASSSLPQ
jgi:hypothetical protein